MKCLVKKFKSKEEAITASGLSKSQFNKILRENGFQNNLPNGYDIENYNNQLLFSRYIESKIPLFKVQIDNHKVTNEYDKLRFGNNTFEIIDD